MHDEDFDDAPPRRSRLRRIALVLSVIAAFPFALTIVYAVVPPVSTLMLARWVTLRPVDRDWVPLEAIDRSLPRAVVVAEDARFCQHGGVDWGAIREVFLAEGGPDRGASTIAMQVAKNLFLWQGGAYLRKPIEIVLAQWIDLVWTKRRIIEVYLNTVEMGPNGTFGAQAASRRAFDRDAGALTERQSALLAAGLPNPHTRDAAKPSRAQTRWAGTVAARARSGGGLFDCFEG